MFRFASLALLGALAISPAAQAAVETALVPDITKANKMAFGLTAIIDRAQLRAHCLALALYFEGGSTHEPEEGLRAISDVAEQRAKANLRKWGGSDICDVVFKKAAGVCQFTFACLPLKRRTPRAGPVWDRMLELAREALSSDRTFGEGVNLYYYNPKKTSRGMQCTFHKEFAPKGFAGSHLFFGEPANKEEGRALAQGSYPECQKSVGARSKSKAKKLLLAKLNKKRQKRSRLANR